MRVWVASLSRLLLENSRCAGLSIFLRQAKAATTVTCNRVTLHVAAVQDLTNCLECYLLRVGKPFEASLSRRRHVRRSVPHPLDYPLLASPLLTKICTVPGYRAKHWAWISNAAELT